jgi:hypothetical protein
MVEEKSEEKAGFSCAFADEDSMKRREIFTGAQGKKLFFAGAVSQFCCRASHRRSARVEGNRYGHDGEGVSRLRGGCFTEEAHEGRAGAILL